MTYDLALLFLSFLFYSFCGWLFEVIYCSLKEGRLINRGFLNGPYCPIYGAGAIAAVILFGDVRNPIALFFASACTCTVMEYATSYAMERIFHARWWDYDGRFLNLNGRVCLAGFMLFGVACIVVIRIIHPALAGLAEVVPVKAVVIVGSAAFVAFVADIIVTGIGLANLRARFDAFYAGVSDRTRALYEALAAEEGAFERVRNALPQNAATEGMAAAASKGLDLLRSIPANRVAGDMYRRLKDRGVDLSPADLIDAFQSRLNDQERRIFAAFPHLQAIDYKEEFAKLRERIDPRAK